VLILVVALLVLMALIGTAFMSMAQSDRVTASLHTNNTEIDLLVDGVVNLVKGAVTNELNASGVSGTYRPAVSSGNYATYGSGEAGTYSNTTALGQGSDSAPPGGGVLPGSTFLASRLPVVMSELNPTGANGVANMSNLPYWQFVTAPIIGSQFSSPLPPQAASGSTPFLLGQNSNVFVPPYSYTQRSQTSSNVFFPTSMTAADGTVYPAWTNSPASANRMLAADTDGDGIADAGYVKLPMGQVNGLTYYVAVRIIDSASAINANTAWVNNTITSAFNGAGSTPPQLPGDFFPTNIDLQDLINNGSPGDTLNALTNNRFSAHPPTGPTAPFIANDDVYNNTSLARVDLINKQFSTAMEAYWMQVGRRMTNPASTPTGFKTLSASDSAYLARNFILAPTGSSLSNYSTLEQFLPNSLVTPAPTTAYNPGDIFNWYNNNFGFMAQFGNTRVLPLRSLMTLSNPVTNYAPNKFRNVGPWSTPAPLSSGGYRFGDLVTFTDSTVTPNQTGHFVCINPNYANLGIIPGDPNPSFGLGRMPASPPAFPLGTNTPTYDNDTWVYEPWSDAPTKTSVNTGTFGQLWLAYWSAMADQFNPINPANPALGGTWEPAFPNPYTPSPSTGTLSPPSRMFRSPLRLATPAIQSNFYLTPVQVMQLRAAIAAVNTIDMRDSDDNVTSRTVHLIDSTNNSGSTAMTDVLATVYGTERQPFITQVYATNATYTSGGSTLNGFVAIQLYNPNPAAINLTNWQLAYITRPDGAILGGPDFRPFPIAWPISLQPVTIPGNSYIVIASNPTPPAPLNFPPLVQPPPIAPAQPVAGQVNLYVVPGLTSALNQELYLFRPHSGSNALTALGNAPAINSGLGFNPLPPPGSAPPISYNEGTVLAPNPLDMVPVDSYDFTGLVVPYAGTTPTEWYYVRPSLQGGATSKAWHFVYPGHYAYHPVPDPLTGLGTNPPRYSDGTVVNKIPPATAGLLGQVLAQAKNVTGAAAGANMIPMDAGQPVAASIAYHDIPLILNSIGAAGPNAVRTDSLGTTESNGFPYGGFARNVDILEVPYIGAYRLCMQNPTTSKWQVLEINTASSDSLMAMGLLQGAWGETATSATPDPTFALTPNAGGNGSDPVYDPTTQTLAENIGRFAPISATDFSTNVGINDFYPAPPVGLNSIPPPSNKWLYHWATRVLDYLTVQCPQQDYLPDVDPSLVDGSITQYNYSPATPMQPQPVANINPNVVNAEQYNQGGSNEQKASVQGLININTAPWQVLAAVPWLPPDYPLYDNAAHLQRLVDQANIALSIVYYRDILDPILSANPPLHGLPPAIPHGPFRSLFELNNVPIFTFFSGGQLPPGTYFRDVLQPGATFTTIFKPDQGKLSPAYVSPLFNVDLDSGKLSYPVIGDFSSKYLMINRVSNLLTTRSDSFVAYILIEGWQNAEQPNAKVAVTRRLAYLIDRSGVTSLNPSPSVTYIPSN